MKKLLLLILLVSTFVDAFDYQKAWKNVETLEREYLPKSIVKELEHIRSEAKKEQESVAYVKASLQYVKYIEQIEQKGRLKQLEYLEKALKEAPTPESIALLSSVLAQLYHNYLNQNFYQINRRTKDKKQYEGIENLEIKEILERVHQLYRVSLDERTQKVPIRKYADVLTEIHAIQKLRPTLYDFLAFRAMEYFSNSQNYLHLPREHFKFRTEMAFAPATLFMFHTFSTSEPKEAKYQTLLFYQKLLQYYYNSNQEEAFELLNVQRILFVYENFEGKERDMYYLDALEYLVKQDVKSSAFVYWVQYYQRRGDLLKSMELIEQCMSDKENRSYVGCEQIKNSIEEKRITVQTEQVNVPHENILAHINYKNSDELFVKVVKLSSSTKEALDKLDRRGKRDYLNALKSVKTFSLSLPKSEKYRTSSTEISLESYEAGEYVFLFSPTNDFTKESFYKKMTVSNMAYFIQEDRNRLLVVNRKTGKPMEGVFCKFSAKDRWTLNEYSDENGFVTIPELDKRYRVELNYNGDVLDFHDSISSGMHRGEPKGSDAVYFFTDRSLYRPNQSIYFKGLATRRFSNKAPKLLTNSSITVTFTNANYQEIASKKFTTDEFGAFHGSFTAPKDGLLGLMYIQANIGGSTTVSVEEYKRPKFETHFEGHSAKPRLGKEVEVRGIAKAYAGNAIDGAKVRYRVERTASFPWSFYGSNNNYSVLKVIKSGEITSDNEGRFNIVFNAEEDEAVENKKQTVYHYTIFANVVDSTGESHEINTALSIGHVNFTVAINVASRLEIDENKSIRIIAKDLDEKTVPITGTLKIEKYVIPNRVYRERFWQSFVTKKMYEKEQFKKLFPSYKYVEGREALKKELVKELEFNTANNDRVDINSLGQGEYHVTLETLGQTGEKLKREREFVVYDPNSKVLLKPSYLSVTKKDKPYEVGEIAQLDLKSTGKNVTMLLTLEQHDEIIEEKWIEVKESVHHELIKIRKSFQGDIHYRVNLMHDNRPFEASGKISVPWNTGLKVEYLSFRDKLKPNEKEQWKIKISGKNKEKVMAQMVATIYDASLDAIKGHTFNKPYLYPYSRMGYRRWRVRNVGNTSANGIWQKQVEHEYLGEYTKIKDLYMSRSNYLGRFYPREPILNEYGEVTVFESEPVVVPVEAVPAPVPQMSIDGKAGETVVQEASFAPKTLEEKKVKKVSVPPVVQVRKNLQETMFFKSDLETDEEGNIIVNFKSNEALTRWNFMAFVHTKDLRTAVTTKQLSTQKELMVVTNLPRFFREKDQIKLSAKVVNMSEKDLNGTCELKLLNALTHEPIFERKFIKNVSLKKGTSTVVEFSITVPNVDKVSAIEHTIIAKTETHSDAEQVVKPILSNRIFITESKLLTLKENEHKKVVFDSLKNNNSKTLSNHKFTLEFTSNPAWYAVRALPYLMEYPHECNEQLFSRYFANALSAHLIKTHPHIAKVFKSWKSKGELKGALESNSELKELLLRETPWVLNAQSEKQKLANLGLLFDLNRLAENEEKTYESLLERQAQNSDGGWAWFEAPQSSWYITQYIVAGFGKLKNLGIDKTETVELRKAVNFLDSKMLESYRDLAFRVQEKEATFEVDNTDSMLMNYLYARSFYHFPMSKAVKKAHDYYQKQAFEFWTKKGLQTQATIAVMLQQNGQEEKAKILMNSFKERAIVSEKGMYFKYKNGYHWNEMPIETHTFMMDAFYQIAHDQKAVELMQKWLLKEKFSSHWKTTTATTAAVYALFAYDSKLLDSTELVQIDFETGLPYKKKLKKAMDNAEEGTGYFKVDFKEFDQGFGTINLKNPNDIEAYGGLYWQYFEELDKVKTFRETPLTLTRKLYKMDGRKPILLNQTQLKVGDKVRVRIQLEVDRDMEYIMLKDSRASAFEPLSSLSGYQHQKGISYYQSTKDSATYFFIEHLQEGKYSFEYPLVVTHKGIFSNGISSIESMYAPEFKSHSKGMMVKVE